MNYRGFEIRIDYRYTNGKVDAAVFNPNSETGHLYPSTTIKDIKSDIDVYYSEIQLYWVGNGCYDSIREAFIVAAYTKGIVEPAINFDSI